MYKPIQILNHPRSVTLAARVVTALVAAAATGCAADAPLDLGAVQQAHITWNGLEFALDTTGQYTVQAQPWPPWIPLADAPLGAPQSHALICTGQGPSIFSYIVKCALEDGVLLGIDCRPFTGPLIPTSNPLIQFSGGLGLAPQWLAGALTPGARLSMTACLAAHYNDVHGVSLSLRGLGLRVDPDERDYFTRREGAFWGDLFHPTQPNVQVCGEAGYIVTQSRDCARQGNPCGFAWKGECGSLFVPCIESTSDHSFQSCDGESSLITTFLP